MTRCSQARHRGVHGNGAGHVRPPGGAARRPVGSWRNASVPRRPAPAQHRAPRWTADAVRCRGVQRRPRLHRRLVRPGLPVDGPVAARPAAPCERRAERIRTRHRRPRRAGRTATLPRLPRRRARQDERDGSAARDRVEARATLLDTARVYLTLRRTLIEPRRGRPGRHRRLVGLRQVDAGGDAGARTSAPCRRAVHLRSDIIRKDIFGVSWHTTLPAAAYTPDVGTRVYARLGGAGRRRPSRPVTPWCCDGVYGDAGERHAVAAVAGGAGDATCGDSGSTHQTPRCSSRVTARRGDASDADARRGAPADGGRAAARRLGAPRCHERRRVHRASGARGPDRPWHHGRMRRGGRHGSPRMAGVTMPTFSTPAPLAASTTATTSP